MSTAPTEWKPPVTPAWFKGRQCKIEALGPDLCKLTGPNLGEAFLQIRRDESARFAAFLRLKQDGEEIARTEHEFDTAVDAWEAAFELYRRNVVC